MNAAGRLVLALVTALWLAGCSSDTTTSIREPTCSGGEDGTASNGVVLMAQAVPTATWVPCMRTTLPGGWTFAALDVRNGAARFWLDSNRDGNKAIMVRLDPSCSTVGATEIPTDREGMRRFERVSQTTPEFRGSRLYVFDGACITFVFKLTGNSGQTRGEPLALAKQAVGAMSRADLQAQVHEESNGRLDLDPPAGSR